MPRGGKRPGAGAPKGNLNAMRHGGESNYVQTQLIPALAPFPELQRWLINYQRRQMRTKAGSRSGASRVLATLIALIQLPPGHPTRKTLVDLDAALAASPTPIPMETLEKVFLKQSYSHGNYQNQSESIKAP